MHPYCLWLVLPIVCVISAPTEYEIKPDDMHKLSNEFWSHHFGPDFQHAIHFDLKQTDLIDTGNVVDKHLPESKDGNKKRSAYTVHKPHNYEKDNRQAGSSMRVHLLQPDEVEALEKEMVNYAKENKMAEPPVVVNLPATEGSTAKNNDHETPVVLNVPPVVYHSNPNMVQPYYSDNGKSAWSHNNKYSAYDGMQKTQSSYDYDRQPSNGDERQTSYEGSGKNPTYEETKQASYEEKTQPLYEDVQEATDGNKDKTA